MTVDEIKKLIATKEGVMLYFWGENCAVCDALKPKIASSFSEHFPKIEQVYINAQESRDIAAEFSVFSIPTTIVFLAGKEFAREGRAMSIAAFIDKIKRPYDIMTS